VNDAVALNHRIVVPSVLLLAFARDYIPVEAMYVFRDVVQTILDCEVSRFKAMHLCLRQIFEEGLPTFSSEKNVILSPEDDCVGLSFF
jgi:hypothetical protein